RAPRGRTSVASGSVGAPFAPRTASSEPSHVEIRRRLAERGGGTYIGEMLAERDSSLARWPDRPNDPLLVWVQSKSDIPGWRSRYVNEALAAFRVWDALRLPVR